MAVEIDDFFMASMKKDVDRHNSNATTFEEIIRGQYAQSQAFRDATAARIVLESGSGRTRSETNAPDNTAAQRATP